MTELGHNERSYRLDAIAERARLGLGKVASGETETLEGWIAYGAALNEGRSLFPGDREFGEWVRTANLAEHNGAEVHDHERAAAMWAAANSEQFEEAQAAGKARTIRGIHSKWKEIEAKREAERKAAEAAKPEVTEAPEGDNVETTEPARETSGNPEADNAEISTGLPVGGSAPDDEPAQPQAEDDPKPKASGLSKYTREGLEDEILGLREENDELRDKLKAAKAEAERFKEANKLLSRSDSGATISNLMKQLGAAKYARDEALSAAKRMEYRMKKALKDAEIEVPYV